MRKSLFLRRVALLAPLLLPSVYGATSHGVPSGPVTIIDTSGGCDATSERTNLGNALTTAGYTVTTITTGVVPVSLTGQQQVWDIRCTTALTAPEITTYTAYLVSGGSLFIMGEYTGFAAARDASLISFIAALGGGSLTLTPTLNAQTAQAPFTGPTALSLVNFRAIGGTTASGSGAFATKDTNGHGGSLVFGPTSLTAAPNGTLILVFDVNFLDNFRSAGETALTNNLIAFLAAPVPVGPAGPPSGPAPPTLILVLLGMTVAAAIHWMGRRRPGHAV